MPICALHISLHESLGSAPGNVYRMVLSEGRLCLLALLWLYLFEKYWLLNGYHYFVLYNFKNMSL